MLIESLLIANRGEIACRIIRTARRMGIRTVAVHSDADAGALHVREADQAVHIGPSPARKSYLVGDKLIAAALETGAQAIHPGYGFLSENAAFAQAVIDAGLIWVGPNPSSIAAMGLKDAAKTLMAEAGVPVTPGYMGTDQDPAHLAEQAAAIGYPVLIKAVAGGGGKGMRRVDDAADFAAALGSCQREAAAAFGNDRVLIEKYILKPRHIEVQVFGDTHGGIVHLFERDCSLQRRHQKVIEEAPAPGMDESTRTQLCEIALRAARAVDYVGAGTIEFIADGSEGLRADRIWFMEMNTRLQVEHPVTEAITGVDLVEWQIRVACGEPLPMRQEELAIGGWAMEARLYAEDTSRGFLPSSGVLEMFDLGEGLGGRIETGVSQGDTVSQFYDPMIAKLVAHGATRDEARRNLAAMAGRCAVWPIRTNAAFLRNALAHPAFVVGEVDTGLIERDGDQLAMLTAPTASALTSAAMTMVTDSPIPGFRLNGPAHRSATFLLDGERVEVALDGSGGPNPGSAAFIVENGSVRRLQPLRTDGVAAATAANGSIRAPMPGRIIAVDVSPGQHVSKGQRLVTLEAMKMEHVLSAPFSGTVVDLAATVGSQVADGTQLVRLEPSS